MKFIKLILTFHWYFKWVKFWLYYSNNNKKKKIKLILFFFYKMYYTTPSLFFIYTFYSLLFTNFCNCNLESLLLKENEFAQLTWSQIEDLFDEGNLVKKIYLIK